MTCREITSTSPSSAGPCDAFRRRASCTPCATSTGCSSAAPSWSTCSRSRRALAFTPAANCSDGSTRGRSGRVGKTEAGVDAAVGEGLYVLESELEFDVIERFDSKATLSATINERDDWQMTGELAARLEKADLPIDGHDSLRLRKYRAR